MQQIDQDSRPDGQVIFLHPDAPIKPPEGAACNGCGLCCLVEPCPLGMVVSGCRQGACVALRWNPTDVRYQCAMVTDVGSITGWQHPWAVRTLTALARRWIAAGVGCDANLDNIKDG